MLTGQKELMKEIQQLGFEVVLPGTDGQMMDLQLQSSLKERIKAGQAGDPR